MEVTLGAVPPTANSPGPTDAETWDEVVSRLGGKYFLVLELLAADSTDWNCAKHFRALVHCTHESSGSLAAQSLAESGAPACVQSSVKGNTFVATLTLGVFRTLSGATNARKKFYRNSAASCKSKARLEVCTDLIEPASSPPPEGTPYPRRLQRAEAILSWRTQRVLLVVERAYDIHNQQAILRTAECLGIQNVWLVLPAELKDKRFVEPSEDAQGGAEEDAPAMNRRVTKGSHEWLSLRYFRSTSECIDALRRDGREIWATDLSKEAVRLDDRCSIAELPPRLAVVMGREADGVSQEMLDASSKRIYLPMYGFCESFNLGIATALVLQKILSFLPCEELRGDLCDEEKHKLRQRWYTLLAKTEEKRDEYSHWLRAPPPPAEDIRAEEVDRVPRLKTRMQHRIVLKESLLAQSSLHKY